MRGRGRTGSGPRLFDLESREHAGQFGHRALRNAEVLELIVWLNYRENDALG